MVALKSASEIDLFLRKAPAGAALVLIFGTDDGLVAERGRALVKAATGGVDDPFLLVKLSGSDLVGDAARLADEAFTMPMFGGRRVIWLREPGRANVAGALEPLFEATDLPSLVVVEAGDIKKGTGLRKLFEEHPRAVAIECRADDAQALERLIEEELKRAGLTIDPDARDALEAQLGADRMASRGEVAKLCLYAHGRGRVTLDDVAAIVGDASAFAVDELVDAVAGGDLDTADMVQWKLEKSGTPAHVAGLMVIRHFHALSRMRAEVDAGQRTESVVEGQRPPIFFKRRPATIRQLGIWTQSRIDRALGLLDQAMLQSRLKPPGLGSAALSDTFLQIARAARAARR